MEPKDIAPIAILIGILVNLYISYKNLLAFRNLEVLKSALSFRENAIEKLSKVQAELPMNIDKSFATKALLKNDSKAAAECIKLKKEEYMKAYNLHSTVRHLFGTELRLELDEEKNVADKLENEAYQLLLSWGGTSDEKARKKCSDASLAFIIASIEYKNLFKKAIETTLVQYSDDLRKHLTA